MPEPTTQQHWNEALVEDGVTLAHLAVEQLWGCWEVSSALSFWAVHGLSWLRKGPSGCPAPEGSHSLHTLLETRNRLFLLSLLIGPCPI